MTTTAIGFSKDLPSRQVMRAVINDTDLAIWRSAAGHLAAWENRCPHRGMRLSHGFVRGESLACMYHGWQFGVDQKCNFIPALPSQAPSDSISTHGYAIAEANELLWVSLSGDAEPSNIDENLMPLRSLAFNCESEHLRSAVLENLPTDLIAGKLALADKGVNENMIHIQSAGKTEVTIVLQKQGVSSVNAHVMVNKQWHKQQCIALSRWCEHIRRIAESNCTIHDAGVQ